MADLYAQVQDLTNRMREQERLVKDLSLRVVNSERSIPVDMVKLSYGNTVLIGRYRNDAEHVLLILDATNGSFNVQLPSAKEVRSVIFVMKKIDETVDTVTLQAQSGEYIHDTGAKANTLVITDKSPINMISDRVDTWLIAG